MRLSLLAAITTAAGLAACAPVGPYGYGYTEVDTAPAAPYGYYDYAPSPYYPGYAAPYAAPGPTIFLGGERRYRDDYRYDRGNYDRGYRGPPPNRDFGRPPPSRPDFGGGRPGPAPVAAPRPPPPAAPPPGPGPGPGPGQGHSPQFNPANPTAQGDRG